MYIYADQNQCRRILKHACCLWSVCQSLLSRKTVNRRCLAMLSEGEPVPAGLTLSERERNKSCLSKHILLPNFLCSVALASRCVLSVPFPELAYNRNPLPCTGCSLWKRKELPKLPLPANISTALPATAVTMCGQHFLGHDHKKVQIFCWSGVEN